MRPHPVLSDNSKIIVITDEAHRSQYHTFALNMRTALPNAAFIAFTGTPLIEGEEERTRQVFGEYVSKYNFKQSVDDSATVPLYYENRFREMELDNGPIQRRIPADFLRRRHSTKCRKKRLSRSLKEKYHVITRDERLESYRRRYCLSLYGTRIPGQGDGRLDRQSHRR